MFNFNVELLVEIPQLEVIFKTNCKSIHSIKLNKMEKKRRRKKTSDKKKPTEWNRSHAVNVMKLTTGSNTINYLRLHFYQKLINFCQFVSFAVPFTSQFSNIVSVNKHLAFLFIHFFKKPLMIINGPNTARNAPLTLNSSIFLNVRITWSVSQTVCIENNRVIADYSVNRSYRVNL